MLIDKRDIKRFWPKVDIGTNNECWEWQASLIHGYGRFKLNGEPKEAHRLSFMLFSLMKDTNNFILHKCNNRKCVNPNHLYEGTPADNIRDYYESVYVNYSKGKLNEESVKVIKWMLKYKPEHDLVTKLARLHKVSQATISNIKRGRSWDHIKV